jgi:hypothetical protein
MVVDEARHAVRLVDTGFRRGQGARVDVGRVDHAALEKMFLAQQDGERVRLLTAAAAGAPELQARVRAQVRQHFLPEGAEVRRIAKELAHLHGEVVEQGGEDLRLAQQPRLQRRERRAAEAPHRGRQAAPQRRLGVAAEVVVPAAVDRLDDQVELDVVGLGPFRGWARRHPDRLRHRGSQTRTSERSLSTSSGLAT